MSPKRKAADRFQQLNVDAPGEQMHMIRQQISAVG